MKLFIATRYAGEDKGDGGIRRIVEAQHRYLPAFGIMPVDSVAEADIVCSHAGDLPDVPIGKPWVVHTHGLYWSEYEWWDWAYKLNRYVIEAMRQADHVTAPSQWVAYALQRGMWLKPSVLYHGIDPELWEPGESNGYVLWNKTRVDPICDASPVDAMALKLPGVQFVSTFGKPRANVRVTGRLSFTKGQELVRHAEIYLATTRETMGIGTLEAMACGVPILGFAWGGQKEIIEHKVTGWLARPGDTAGLIEGYHWLKEHRAEVGAAAREVCMKRFTWPDVMGAYADLYKRLVDEPPRPKVSVIVPCYNLAQYLPAALESVQNQTLDDWECIIVDDCSPDDTGEIARAISRKDKRFKYIRNESNLYLAGALNAGIAASRGRYVLPLDADNMITSQTLETLSEYLDQNRHIAIAYGSVQFVTDDLLPDKSIAPDGVSSWPWQFNYLDQIKHKNQIPSTCMYRRAVWERTGGYRSRWRTAEDAAFWTHATSYGFDARKCTDMVTLVYRNRHDSMSHTVKEPDWTAWIPWAKDKSLIPFGAPIQWGERQPGVPSCEPALVTVITPVGPGHERVVIDALDSIEAQSFRAWRAIVINDTGAKLDIPHPWATVIDTDRIGAAAARNAGIALSETDYFVLLDADDILQPDALQELWQAHLVHADDVIYSQWFDDKGNGAVGVYDPPEYDPCHLIQKGCIYAITALYPKRAWEAVRGFDTAMANWEDWDFQVALADAQICATKVRKPLWTYRKTTGARREDAMLHYERGKDEMLAKWGKYWEGGQKFMGCGGCGGTRRTGAATSTLGMAMKREGVVVIEYTGKSDMFPLKGRSTGKVYRFGTGGHRVRKVWAADAPTFDALPNMFRRVEQIEKFEPVLGAKVA